MKKVISALTAATMVASMSASVMSAFAVYSANDVTFFLKANPTSYYEGNADTGFKKVTQTANFTVSDDGKTITFASAADAAGAKIGIGTYIGVADTSASAIQQIGGMVKTTSDKITFVGNAVLDAPVDGDTTQTYTYAGGKTFESDQFVNTFGYYKRGYKYNTMAMTQEVLDASQIPNGGTSAFMWIWGADLLASETAAFLGDNSDDYPMTEFTIALDSSITDGTYTLEYDTVMTNDYGKNDATFVAQKDTEAFTPSTLEGLTIIVGNAEETSEDTQPSSEEDTQPSSEETQPSSEEDTQPTSEDTTEPVVIDGYTWKIDDVEFENPDASNEDSYVEVPILVYNDPGTYGVQFRILIDGKTLDDPDCPFICDGIDNGRGYTRIASVIGKTDTGFAALAIQGTDTLGDEQCKDGGAAMIYTFLPKEGVTYTPGTVYKLTFDTTETDDYWPAFANEAKENLMPQLTLAAGSITIPGGETTEPSSEETEPSSEETEPSSEETEPSSEETEPSSEETEPSSEETQPSSEETQPGNYLYGDVNKNGKVELVDIVMLNRFLTKYDNQTLDAYQVEVANCAGNTTPGASKESDLDGQDSIEILKYLIGLVASLPSQG